MGNGRDSDVLRKSSADEDDIPQHFGENEEKDRSDQELDRSESPPASPK